MTFQDDFAVVAALAARDGKCLPDVLSIPVEKQEMYMQIIRETAADLRTRQAEARHDLDVFDVKLAHAVAETVETLVREQPVTVIREQVFALPFAANTGLAGFMTILLVPQSDGTVNWTVNNIVGEGDNQHRISVYIGAVGVDGLSYARMHLDTDSPIPLVEVTR